MLGLIKPETITKCLNDDSILHMDQYPIEVMMGLKKTFVLYVNMPKSRWPDIRRSEPNTPEGNRIFNDLKQEYMDKHFMAPQDNPNAEAPNTADLEYGMPLS